LEHSFGCEMREGAVLGVCGVAEKIVPWSWAVGNELVVLDCWIVSDVFLVEDSKNISNFRLSVGVVGTTASSRGRFQPHFCYNKRTQFWGSFGLGGC
jgi:hypothetical protein